MEARFIELAGYINAGMPQFVLDKIQVSLNDHDKPLRGSRVYIMGVAYKRDIDDLRESPALDLIHHLQKRGAVVSYSDPFIHQIHLEDIDLEAVPESFAGAADCAVVATDHSGFDYEKLVARAPLIVDCRNSLKDYSSPNVVRL